MLKLVGLILLVVVASGDLSTPKPVLQITEKFMTTTSTIAPHILKAKLPEVVKNAAWECGTDEFTKGISEGEILSKCPKLRDHMNSCCYQHDNCYDTQLGQKFCDDSFCSCLERRSRSSKSCHDESAPLFCELVRTFGEDAYNASAPNATTTEESIVEKDDYDYESQVKQLNNVTLPV